MLSIYRSKELYVPQYIYYVIQDSWKQIWLPQFSKKKNETHYPE